MLEVFLFAEDSAHEQVVGALINRIAADLGKPIHISIRNSHGGIGRVKSTFDRFLKDVARQSDLRVDVIVVATDANCKGLNERRKEFQRAVSTWKLVLAIADPHIERWLMLDGAAFKTVFEKGCQAPDLKCERDRYKQMLQQQISNTGVVPSLGGIEFAEELVAAMNLDRVSKADQAFATFRAELTTALSWNA